MMAVVPFRWQGRARSEQVRAFVAMRSQEWLRQWCMGSPQPEVAVASTERPDSGRNTDRWYQVVGAAGTLSLRVSATTIEQLGCRLADVPTTDSAGLAIGVGTRAFRDFALMLANAKPDEALLVMDMRPLPQAVDSRCGAVGLHWLFEQIRVELYLDAAMCDSLLPRPAAAAHSLTSRQDAILPGNVTLSAVLDLGQVALADTLLLKPGEIIKTGIPLDSHIEVRSDSGATVFTGALIASDGHRALRCVRN